MTERPVRVLIVCDHIDYDGALHGGGRQLIELTRALDRDRVEPTVCVLRGASKLGKELQAEGLPFHFFGDARFNPVTLARLVSIIRERDIDVLHLTDFGASTLGRLAAKLTGRPAIVQVISHHSRFQHRGFPLYVSLAYRALAPLTDRALAISASVKEFATERMGFEPNDVEILEYPMPRHSWSPPNADDVRALRQTLGIGSEDPVVGSVTRFYPSKGMRVLVEAFALVLRSSSQAWLVLVGQGPEEAALRARCRELGMERRVHFAGFQREAQVYAGMFNVSVVPSIEEGFGLVALESLALGVPTVASRVGGLPDIITDGESGLLVEPGDPVALAEAISRVLDDSALSERLREGGPREVPRFSLDRYVTRLTEIYGELAIDRATRSHMVVGRAREAPAGFETP